MSALTDLKTLKDEINKLRKDAQDKVEAVFKTAVLELFTEYPNLKRINWTQYTPYFNDGDPCTFRSHHDCPHISFTTPLPDAEDEDEDDGYEEEWSESSYYDYSKDYKSKTVKTDLTEDQLAQLKAGQAVIGFLKHFDDDDMDHLFGDGFKVSITAKGIDVDDYEHY